MLGALAEHRHRQGRRVRPRPASSPSSWPSAVRGAAALMNDYFMNDAFVRTGPTATGWPPSPRTTSASHSSATANSTTTGAPAAFTFWATWAPKRLGDPTKLPASYYLKWFRDSDGELFNGDTLYRLRIPADIPAHDFWSIVAYEVGTNAFIHNPNDRVAVSSYDKASLATNDDGSVDVYIGPDAPDGMEANWIPTAGKDFWLICRFYGPDQPLFDGTWRLADVERLQP